MGGRGMGRVAVIKIVGGNFEQGFPVWLEICQDGVGLPRTTIKGQLSPQPILEGLYISWLFKFRGMRSPYKSRNLSRSIEGWDIDTSLPINVGIDEDVKACREIVEQLEKNFQHWLQQSADAGWQKIREKLVEELAKNPDSLRITIQTENRCLWKMPWHAWDVLSRYPEVGVGFSLPEFSPPPKSEPVGSRVRVLAVLGNSDNIDLTADRAALEALPDADVVVLEEPSAAEVMQHLRDEGGWDIFCFAGHSESESDTGRIYINKTENLKVGEFKHALEEAIARGLKLAIFNSCDGLGLARDLASLQLPVAIVMKEPVPDIVAQSFLTNFLKEYAGGKSLYASVRRAGERLEEFKDLPGCTWLPIVCQNPAEVPPSWADLRGELTSQRLRYRDVIVNGKEERSQPKQVQPIRIGQRQRFLTMAIATLLVVGLPWLGILEPLELKAFDHLIQNMPKEAADKKLLIVKADEADITEYDFPLPDAVLVQLIDKLKQHGPSAIGLNIIRDIPNPKTDIKSSEELIARFQQNQNLIAVCQAGHSLDSSAAPPARIPAKQVGFFDFFPELPQITDDNIRTYILSRSANAQDKQSNCYASYSFGFVLAEKYLYNKNIVVKPVEKRWKLGVNLVPRLNSHSGGYQNLDANGYRLLMRYRHTPRLEDIAQTVSIRDILTDSPAFNPAWVKDRVVLIGVTAKTVQYSYDTPYGKTVGLYIHAHAVSQILSAVEDDRPLLWWWPQWADNLWVAFWWSVGAVIVWQSQRPLHQWLRIIISIAVLYIFCWFALTQAGWIPLIPAGLALISTSAAKLFYDMLKNDPSRQS